jgi:hypothetical protein
MKLFSVALTLILVAVTTRAGDPFFSITLRWNQIKDPRVEEIRIYYGEQTHLYSGFFSAGPRNMEARITNLEPGRPYYFAAASHNSLEGDGQLSQEVKILPDMDRIPSTATLSLTE